MSRIVPLRTRRIHQAITLTRDQCERILDAACLLPPPHRPPFVRDIEAKLREGESTSDVLLLRLVDASYSGMLRIEACDD
jgi:hypothetical protein